MNNASLKSIIAYYVGATLLGVSAEEQNVRLAHCANLGVAPRDALCVHSLRDTAQRLNVAAHLSVMGSRAAVAELIELRETASWLFVRDALHWACTVVQGTTWAHDWDVTPENHLFPAWELMASALTALTVPQQGLPLLNDGRAPHLGCQTVVIWRNQIAGAEGMQIPAAPAGHGLAAGWAARKTQIFRSKAFTAFYADEDVRGPFLARMKDRADARTSTQQAHAVQLAICA